MENMGEDNSEQTQDNSLPEEKTSQDELEALLQQSQAGQTKKSGLVLPKGDGKKTNWLIIGIVVLAVVLLATTIYFLIWGIGANKGSVVFYLNEEQVSLVIDKQDFEKVDSGFEIDLSAGIHLVTTSKEGFLEMQDSFEVVRGETTEIALELLPIPFIEPLLESLDIKYARLSLDGSEVSYFNNKDNRFKSVDVESSEVAKLFEGRTFAQDVLNVSWSAVERAAIVQLSGARQMSNMIDNRSVRGAYIPLGERPVQGASNYIGVGTWLFDDTQNNVSGWQPVLLNESVRENTFGVDGGSIMYLYSPVGDEYSLIRANPDGSEWTRVALNLPIFDEPKLIWSSDDRYLLIEDRETTYLVDVLAGVADIILVDRVMGSDLKISPDGDKIMYISKDKESGQETIKIFNIVDMENVQTDVFDEMDIVGAHFIWTSNHTILMALSNQTFRELDIEDGGKKLIPFVGQDIDFEILELEYSRLGRVLMLETTKGLFKMKV